MLASCVAATVIERSATTGSSSARSAETTQHTSSPFHRPPRPAPIGASSMPCSIPKRCRSPAPPPQGSTTTCPCPGREVGLEPWGRCVQSRAGGDRRDVLLGRALHDEDKERALPPAGSHTPMAADARVARRVGDSWRGSQNEAPLPMSPPVPRSTAVMPTAMMPTARRCWESAVRVDRNRLSTPSGNSERRRTRRRPWSQPRWRGSPPAASDRTRRREWRVPPRRSANTT